MTTAVPQDEIARRGWPRPKRRHNMSMVWHDLLFIHWPVPVESLRPHIPTCFEIDTFDGSAYLAFVPFGMSGVQHYYMPSMPWVSKFPEMNVRTYVRCNGKPGVWFFTLDAANPLAVRVARWLFHLNYLDANMRMNYLPDGWIEYYSKRTHPGASPAMFVGQYRPTGEPLPFELGSLERWFTERYCLYTVNRKQEPFCGEIDHPPWPLQPAEAHFEYDGLLPAGVVLPDQKPHLHYAKQLKVVAWTLERAS